MTALLFGAAIGVVMILFTLRGVKRRRFEGRRAGMPGLSPESAIRVQRFDEIQDWVRTTPCRDGSRPEIVSEGSLQLEGRTVRVVHVECSSCADEFSLYFDLSELLN